MKTLITTLAATSLAFCSLSAMARDIGPDEALKLRDSGAIKHFDAMNKAALERHPGSKITDTELEEEYGRYIYQVEIRDAKGQDRDLEFDAKTGELLRDYLDS